VPDLTTTICAGDTSDYFIDSSSLSYRVFTVIIGLETEKNGLQMPIDTMAAANIYDAMAMSHCMRIWMCGIAKACGSGTINLVDRNACSRIRNNQLIAIHFAKGSNERFNHVQERFHDIKRKSDCRIEKRAS